MLCAQNLYLHRYRAAQSICTSSVLYFLLYSFASISRVGKEKQRKEKKIAFDALPHATLILPFLCFAIHYVRIRFCTFYILCGGAELFVYFVKEDRES